MIIITGGAGFIGSNLVKGLNDRGFSDILIVDNLGTSQKFLNLNRLKFADYIDKEDFLTLLPKLTYVDAIIHQGACSSTTQTDVNYLIHNNYQYSKRLLSHAIEHKIKFIYASSAAVYGNGENGFTEHETSEYALNGYAFSKLIFDNFVRKNINFKTTRTQVTGLRYFNVYGYQENHKGSMASVPFHFFNQSLESNKIKVFEGSEHFLRDFIFVEDVVKTVIYFINNAVSGIFNCGTGEARSFMDMAKIFQNLHGNCEIEVTPFPPHLKGKYQAYTKADLTLLRANGYHQPFTSLEEGLEKYYQQLLHSNGYF
jgi:ADP-L-glycero-D-manno-heptose 6-epimerase